MLVLVDLEKNYFNAGKCAISHYDHPSLSGKCAKQLTGVCAPSLYYYQIEKKTTAETITAHSSPSKYSSPLLPKIIQLLPVQLLPVQLLPALARAEI